MNNYGKITALYFRLFMEGKNRNQIAVYLKNGQIPTPTFYLKEHGREMSKKQDAERGQPLSAETACAEAKGAGAQG